jgi:hypothetical protein
MNTVNPFIAPKKIEEITATSKAGTEIPRKSNQQHSALCSATMPIGYALLFEFRVSAFL